jgi:ubiquinone/menaquinone biosynthesis C-methylase UbiE
LSLQKTYNRIAKKFSKTRHYPWPEFEDFLKYIPKNAKVLDIGCGNGRLYEFLKKQKNYRFEYIGIDFSEELLAEARLLHPDVKFICMDMKLLKDFKEKNFDIIFFIASFHHLNSVKDRLKVLAQSHKLLKIDGKICMTNWNLFQKKYFKYFIHNSITFFSKLFTKNKHSYVWNDVSIPFNNNGEVLQRYYHAFTHREIYKLLKQASFKIIDSMSYNKKIRQKFWWKGKNISHVIEKE